MCVRMRKKCNLMDPKQMPLYYLHSLNNLCNKLSLAISRMRNNFFNQISHIFFVSSFSFLASSEWTTVMRESLLVNLYCSAYWSNNPETLFGRFSLHSSSVPNADRFSSNCESNNDQKGSPLRK